MRSNKKIEVEKKKGEKEEKWKEKNQFNVVTELKTSYIQLFTPNPSFHGAFAISSRFFDQSYVLRFYTGCSIMYFLKYFTIYTYYYYFLSTLSTRKNYLKIAMSSYLYYH